MEDGSEKRDDKKPDGEKHKKRRSYSNMNNLAHAVFCIGGVLARIMLLVGYPQLCNLDVVSPDTYGVVDIVELNPHKDSYTWCRRMYVFSTPAASETCPAYLAFCNNAIIATICEQFPVETLGMTLRGINPSFARHLGDISCQEVNHAALLRWVRTSRPFHHDMLNMMDDEQVVEELLQRGLYRERYDMRNFLFKELWKPQFISESHIRTLIRHDLDHLARWMRSAPYEIRNRWMHGLWDQPEDLAAFCALVRGRMHGVNYLYLIFEDLKQGDTRRTTDSMTYFLREVYNLEDWRLVDIIFERYWDHTVFQKCAMKAFKDLKYRRTPFIDVVKVLIHVHFLRVHVQNRENKKKK